VRRMRSQRKAKSGAMSGSGRRPSQRSGESERPTRRIEGTQGDEDVQKKDASRPGYGFMDNQRGRKETGRGDQDGSIDTEGLENDMEVERSTDQSADIKERPRGKTEDKEDGRPDQLSTEEDEEVTDRMDLERSDEERDGRNRDPHSMNTEVEPAEIEESDEEARGGGIVPDDSADEELRNRRKSGPKKNRTNSPE
jgi:hypothetical protein